MIVVPMATPLTTPVEEPIVATEVLLLAHVPPEVEHVTVPVPVAQILVLPPNVAGVAFTVITCVRKHADVVLLTVIRAVPATWPCTIPVDDPTDATPALLLVQ